MAAAMAISGTVGVFVLESGQSAWNVVFLRCVFGALGLLAYCLARGLLRPGIFTRATLAWTLVAGVAIVLNWVLLFSAYRLASISLATAVYNFRSEEHTSELQSLMRISYAVFCLKKKKKNTRTSKH